jgi:hypothetical protein
MVRVRTEELAGPALYWAINAIDGDQQSAVGQLQLFTQIDADQLIEKYGVWVERGYSYPWLADATHDPCNRQPGETREIAVYRAVVFANTGNTISVPAELI